MNLPRMAIKRGVTWGMLYLIALGFGLFSLSRLKLDLFPDINFPMVAVITRYTGVGPFDMETVISRPIERSVVGVAGVKRVTSSSRNGVSFVVLEFNWGYDMKQAETDVRRSLEWVETTLPDDATKPLVFAYDIKQMPVMFMGAGSPVLDAGELRRVCKDLVVPRLERIDGVAAVDVTGGLERQIRVDVDASALASYGLPINQVISALSGANLQVPGGLIRDGRTSFSVRTIGEYVSLDQIQNTIVTVRGAQVIHVRDVATVTDGFKDLEGSVRVNGANAVQLIARKQSDANTVQVANRILAALPDIQAAVPGQIQLTPIFNQAEFIQMSVGNLTSNGLQAVALTVLILLLFLRHIPSTLVVAASIPTSVIVTFSVMNAYGTTLNIISMAGLALGIGMLVDNSIVALENIFRHRELGYGRREAAELGTNQIAMPIIASTLTTVVVFVPVLFVPGIAGVMFNDMVVTVCFSLMASLLVALTLVPLLTSRILSEPRPPRTRVVRALNDAVGSGLEWLYATYAKSLKWSLGHRKWVIFGSTALFIGSIALVYFVVGVDFLPKTDDSRINFTVEHAVGTDLPTTMKTLDRIEAMIREEVPEAKVVNVSAGSGGSLGSIFRGLDMNSGSVQIKLSPIAERKRSKFEIEDVLRKRLADIPGTTVTFAESHGPSTGGADIEVKLFGDDLDVTGSLADELVAKIKDVPGATDVASSLERGAPELQITLNRDRLQALGMTAGQVTSAISNAVQGTAATAYREGGSEYDVYVRLADQYRRSPEQVENLMLTTPSGNQVPLRQMAEVRREVGPISIAREDQSRIVTVSVTVSGRDLGGVVSDIQDKLKTVSIPSDVIVEIGGTAEDQQESFRYLGLAVLAGIILVYMVMASQFESLLDPFIIMVTVPLSFIGVALALFITNTTLSLMALIGMLILVGIVVNNGIVLVDFTNILRREQGKELFEAALEAGRTRMRPVLMTALTTIFGMLPLALGLGESGETWAPLARAVMGGLTTATILTLVAVPVTYTVFESLALRFHSWRERRQMKLQPAEPAEV